MQAFTRTWPLDIYPWFHALISLNRPWIKETPHKKGRWTVNSVSPEALFLPPFNRKPSFDCLPSFTRRLPHFLSFKRPCRNSDGGREEGYRAGLVWEWGKGKVSTIFSGSVCYTWGWMMSMGFSPLLLSFLSSLCLSVVPLSSHTILLSFHRSKTLKSLI